MMRGKFIVFEGIDGCGKSTQTKLLCQKLDDLKIKYEFIHFPVYDSFYGGIIKKYLKGELGELDEVPVEIPCLLFAADRYNQRNRINEYLERGIHVICDRYIASNMGFQAAKFESKKERKTIISWLESVEHRLPQPDIHVLLELPVKTSQELIGRRGEKDIHEQDVIYQERIRETFLKLWREKKWKIINCVKNDELMNPQEIHKKIWDYIRNLI